MAGVGADPFAIICDHCHEPIVDAHEAVKCTRWNPRTERKEYIPGTFHSGACADAVLAADKSKTPAPASEG